MAGCYFFTPRENIVPVRNLTAAKFYISFVANIEMSQVMLKPQPKLFTVIKIILH